MQPTDQLLLKCQVCTFEQRCTRKQAGKIEDNHFFTHHDGDHYCDWIEIAK